ncbi:hypothetical protein CR513_09482, partial [Mucuna pruriens]
MELVTTLSSSPLPEPLRPTTNLHLTSDGFFATTLTFQATTSFSGDDPIVSSSDLSLFGGDPSLFDTYSCLQTVRLEVRDLWFGEFKKEYSWDPSQEKTIRVIFEKKGSCIYKNTMNKIRNGHSATWIPSNVLTILDEHWASTDFQNKRSIVKASRAIDK